MTLNAAVTPASGRARLPCGISLNLSRTVGEKRKKKLIKIPLLQGQSGSRLVGPCRCSFDRFARRKLFFFFFDAEIVIPNGHSSLPFPASSCIRPDEAYA